MTTARPLHAVDDRSALLALAVLGVFLVALNALTPWMHHKLGASAFMISVTLQAAVSFFVARQAAGWESTAALGIVLVAAFASRGLLLFTEPYLSTDVWRYVWDGRVQGAGINPYRYIPAAPELASLRDAVVYPNINRADYAPTIYPPMAQWVFFLATRLSDSMLAMKATMLAFDAATIAALIALLRLLGRPLLCVAAYAWHPLPIWEIAGNGHVDAVMVALLMWSLWIAFAGSPRLAGTLATLAALVKPTALLALPVYWRPWDWRLVATVAAVVVGMYLPFVAAGWGVLGFGPGYLQEEGLLSGSGLWLPQLFMEPRALPGWLTAVLLGAGGTLLAYLAVSTGFRRDRSPDTSIGLLLLMILVFLDIIAPNYPWYFLVAAAFLPLTRALSPWIFATFALAFYDFGPPGATWISLHLAKVALYLVASIAMAFDIYTGRLPGRQDRGASIP